VFADQDAAEEWFSEHDPEGVAFAYRVLQKRSAIGKLMTGEKA